MVLTVVVVVVVVVVPTKSAVLQLPEAVDAEEDMELELVDMVVSVVELSDLESDAEL